MCLFINLVTGDNEFVPVHGTSVTVFYIYSGNSIDNKNKIINLEKKLEILVEVAPKAFVSLLVLSFFRRHIVCIYEDSFFTNIDSPNLLSKIDDNPQNYGLLVLY